MSTPLKTQITARARELDFDFVGFASAAPAAHADYLDNWLAQQFHGEMNYMARDPQRRKDPRALLPEAKTIIIAALNYNTDALHAPRSTLEGIVARYARGDDYHEVMREKLNALAAFIREIAPDAKNKVCVDTSALLERELAQQAGVGFVGKSTILINRSLGTWFFLGEILTSLELEPDAPQKNLCGKCVRCIEVCPTQAIVAPFQLDSRRCISYLTIELKGVIPRQLRPLIGARIFGCDDCLEVCPWNRFARLSRQAAFQPRQILGGAGIPACDVPDAPAPLKPQTQNPKPDLRPLPHAPRFTPRPLTSLAAPDLVALLSLDEKQFHQAFRNSPIHRIQRRGLLRNVCVALGNSGDPRAVPALRNALSDREPLIRAHAAWALGRLGGEAAYDALEQALSTEENQSVREEIQHALTASGELQS